MILVVGCGAIGSVVAVHLAQVVDVAVVDVDELHLRVIGAKGLRMVGRTPLTGTMAKVVGPQQLPELAGEGIEAIIVCTKSIHTRKALVPLRPWSGDVLVLSIQNGWGNLEEIQAAGFSRVLLAATRNAARILEPGVVEREMVGKTWIGPGINTSYEDAVGLADLLSKGGMESVAVPDPRGHIWAKLLFNAAVNPVTALSQLPARFVVERTEGRWLMEQILAEGTAVVRAWGVTLPYDPAEAALAPRPAAHLSSMAQDIQKQRLTEIDYINGAIVRLGRQVGVATPINELWVSLIHLIEAGWTGWPR